MAIKNGRRQAVYGLGPNAYGLQFPDPIVTTRDPQGTDVGGAIGQYWLNTDTPAIFMLTGFSGGQAQWVNMIGGEGVFSSLTVSPGPISLTGTTTITGTTSINTTGTAATAIGNATGNTTVTGTLTVSSNIFATNGSVSAGNTAASASASNLQMLKSRSGGVITTGDALGQIIFAGNDGTTNVTGAAITSTNSGTVATNRIAANLNFFTHPDSTTAAQSRMVIAPAGNVTVNTPDSGTALTISAAATAISATTGDITIANGNLNVTTAGKGIVLPTSGGVLAGTGDPGAPLATSQGILYIKTNAAGTTDRLWVSTGVGTWTYFVSNA